jgi:large subunit ribosomal protein L4
MPSIKVMDMTGKEVGSMDLSDVIFGAEVNEAVLHAAVRMYLMNQRQGTQSTLTRTEVSGGGKKPWRQKGTGRARQGSTRSPQWTHGGVALGPKPRDYRLAMNKKTKRVALFRALSAKVAAGELVIVDEIKLDTYKTDEMAKMFKALGCEKTVTKNYKVTTTDENGEQRDPEYCVIYTVTSYPDYSSGKSHITRISITDPEVSVYGVTLTSSAEDIKNALTEAGFSVTEKNGGVRGEKGRFSVSFSADSIYIHADVSNRFGIQF